MSAATSPGTGLAYGLRRVCAAWGMARSSFYAMTSGQNAERPPAKRRGPKPAISDQALLVAIEADLETSPWEGEGYRKVWARLRVCRDIRVARKRVLRLMRENNLLSPHRCRRRGGNPHDGEIITHAPNLMWGTDGVRVFTVDDGWGWIFTAVEHWNAECVGWHVCKRGDRFAALQPISMGLAGLYGSTAAGAARGLALRMDHGSQYLSDHFTNQIKFWGIQPSYAFVAEPQTNGVAERFNRTLKEQIIHGRIYRNIAELRDAVRDFVELYNAQWIVEKKRLPEPRSSSSGVARRDLNQARRVRQTCVQGTGCATVDRGYVDFARLYVLHQAGAFFVTRAKSNIDAHRVYSAPTDRSTGIICDQTISLDGFYTRQDYPELLRRIRFKDPESGKTLVFITNNFSLPAATICALYKSRWQVELFFKWIKQHLRIKQFYGTSENAVKTQIWIAVSVYVLVAIVKKRLDLDASLYTLLQILSVTLFEKMPIHQALAGDENRCNAS